MTVIIDKAKCIGCGACVTECPFEALDLIDGIAAVDPQKCTDCGKCLKICPTEALALPDKPKKKMASKESDTPKRPLSDIAKDNSPDSKKASEGTHGEWTGVWVIIEYINSKIAPVSWELLGEGRKLADAVGCELCGVITGYELDGVIPEIYAYGAEKVYVVDHQVLKDYRSEPYADAMTDLILKYKPEIVLMGATSMGRDVFPAVAAKLQTGLTADCTVLGIDPDTKILQQTRPAFGGNIMATILCRNKRPQMATVRPRVMAMPERVEGRTGELVREEVHFDEANIATKVLDFIATDAKSAFLDKAEIIVSVGLGLGAKRNLVIAEDLAEVLGGTIAGTRGTVEAGWLTHDQQVGQTGATVRPKVYIAIGISGAIQHLVGMQTSDFIIAINNDPEAPILKVANYGLVGDLFQIVPALTAAFKKRLQHGVAN
ncbi:MAG: Caffeyl-CoA reductase-Etf complex subunit CarE [Candidatus Dichloromethanomonas elyunquensis]|nr:MAG: Caffeyl-CoA reductase-Etf complex subunit CarE [Candidatus Dichloromethanomonas elyunquensis]